MNNIYFVFINVKYDIYDVGDIPEFFFPRRTSRCAVGYALFSFKEPIIKIVIHFTLIYAKYDFGRVHTTIWIHHMDSV